MKSKTGFNITSFYFYFCSWYILYTVLYELQNHPVQVMRYLILICLFFRDKLREALVSLRFKSRTHVCELLLTNFRIHKGASSVAGSPSERLSCSMLPVCFNLLATSLTLMLVGDCIHCLGWYILRTLSFTSPKIFCKQWPF